MSSLVRAKDRGQLTSLLIGLFLRKKIPSTWKVGILFVATGVTTALAVYTDTASWNAISQKFLDCKSWPNCKQEPKNSLPSTVGANNRAKGLGLGFT